MRTATLWAGGLLLWGTLVAPGCQPRLPERPNIILFTVDGLRWDHLKAYGYRERTSATLERLALRGVVFENATVAHTRSLPSQASILTGRDPFTHGLLKAEASLAPMATTLASLLKKHGYQTAACVSDRAFWTRAEGLRRGFDHFSAPELARERRAERTYTHCAEWLHANRDKNRPLLLFVHFADPRAPYRAPGRYADAFLPHSKHHFKFPLLPDLARLREGRARPEEIEEYVARYDGEIAYSGRFVGSMLRTLQSVGAFKKAVIIATGSHGETLGERPWVFDHGARVYEEQIRVPLLFQFPGKAYQGKRIAGVAHHTDLFPTVLDMLKLPMPPRLEGRSLWPAIRGKEALQARTTFSLAEPHPARVPELGRPIAGRGQVVTVRKLPYKLIVYPARTGPVYQLFNLEKDPGERTNLVEVETEKLDALVSELWTWRGRKNAEGAQAQKVTLGALGYLE